MKEIPFTTPMEQGSEKKRISISLRIFIIIGLLIVFLSAASLMNLAQILVIYGIPGATSYLAEQSNVPEYYDKDAYSSRVSGAYGIVFKQLVSLPFRALWILAPIIVPPIFLFLCVLLAIAFDYFCKKYNLTIPTFWHFIGTHRFVSLLILILLIAVPLAVFVISLQNPAFFNLHPHEGGEIKVFVTPEYYLAFICDLLFVPFLFLLSIQLLRALSALFQLSKMGGIIAGVLLCALIAYLLVLPFQFALDPQAAQLIY